MFDQPRLLPGAASAAYCSLRPSTFSAWVAAGRLPKPLPGTRRWDRKALDLALDALSGIAPSIAPGGEEESALAKWMREDEEEWERKYDEREASEAKRRK